MPNIPNELVYWGVEHIMEGYCELRNAQTSAKMTTISSHGVYDVFPEVRAELRKIRPVELFDVFG